MLENSSAGALLCDGCGRLAGPAHLAQRIARLEQSTRFRPVHIQLLFLAQAPPADAQREFYSKSGASDALLDALGIAATTQATEPGERWAVFQKLGLYLAHLVECPLEGKGLAPGAEPFVSGSPDLARRFAPTLLKRIRFSYRPKRIALLSPAMRHLIPLLRQAGLGDALLLNAGAPLEVPEAGNPSATLAFRTLVEAALAANPAPG